MSKVAFLVPRREDKDHRDRLWAHCKRRWQRDFPDWPIVEGHHTDGLFNRGAAINLAATKTDADIFVIIDSDVMVRRSQVLAAVDSAEQGVITWAHRRWREFHETWTRRVLADRELFDPEFADVDLDLYVERTNPISWSCCQAIRRDVFEAMGGFDQRFKGWGFEDGAWAALVRGKYQWSRIEGDVINLWHPRSPERIVLGESADTASADYVRNALLGRRYMIAAIRDHKVGDQLGEENLSDEMVAVHVDNLTKDDARFLALARAKNMPEARWDRWWPSLDELVAGAKLGRSGPMPDVTLIVRTGGESETWPERSAYLRRSLDSLVRRVSGPISVKRIYSDWGTERKPELDAIGAEYGFKVVGPEHHVGYAKAVQSLWWYIDRQVSTPFVFLAEDDFIYERAVDLRPMMETLEGEPNIAQMALLRDAAYPREFEAGGVLASLKTPLTPVAANGHSRIEHRDHWTMNPSLVRRSIVAHSWPDQGSSERVFGDRLLRESATRFAYWGDGTPWITHIGAVRAASAY